MGAAVALSTPHIFTGCDKKKTPTQPAGINAQVAAVRGDNLDTITRDALDALGGIGKIVNQGETVFIKPNMVTLPWVQRNPFILGECTKPEIIVAVAEECLKAGASQVIIGDGSQMYTFNWKYAATLDGSTDLVQEAQRLSWEYDKPVTLACLEDDSPEFVEVPSRTYLGQIAISSLLTSADRVISIPVAKTHSWAQLTLALKNFVGVTSLERYAVWVNDSYWDRGGALDHSTPQAIGQIYLDVVDAVRPDLSLVDFSIGIEGDGPTLGSGGTTVDMRDRLGSWLVIASPDIMAADATAARIMSHDVFDVKQLPMGFDMGLGEIRENSIEMIGEKLDDLIVPWAPANLRNAKKYVI
jgi:uncharacterized protein (DUF362 family)